VLKSFHSNKNADPPYQKKWGASRRPSPRSCSIVRNHVILWSWILRAFSSYPKLRKCGIFKSALVDKFLKTTYGAPLVNLPS
jgi:hypothetical protein